jgi:hypothetical protein
MEDAVEDARVLEILSRRDGGEYCMRNFRVNPRYGYHEATVTIAFLSREEMRIRGLSTVLELLAASGEFSRAESLDEERKVDFDMGGFLVTVTLADDTLTLYPMKPESGGSVGVDGAEIVAQASGTNEAFFQALRRAFDACL